MPVYVVQAGDGGPVKIGTTTVRSLTERLRTLQSGNAVGLRLVHLQAGDAQNERRLHIKFEASRIRGEWFRVTPLMRRHFSLVPLKDRLAFSLTPFPASHLTPTRGFPVSPFDTGYRLGYEAGFEAAVRAYL